MSNGRRAGKRSGAHFIGATNSQCGSAHTTILLRRLDPLLPLRFAPEHRGQKLPGVAALHPHDVLRRTARHDLASAVAAFAAAVDDPIAGLSGHEILVDPPASTTPLAPLSPDRR